jgi:hypothetical protein
LTDLVTSGDGIAVLDAGIAFGGGALQSFGINSNTSASGFIRCMNKKVTKPNAAPSPQKQFD